jgi:hypothetical protein
LKISSCSFSYHLRLLSQDLETLKAKAEIEKDSEMLLFALRDLERVHRLIARHQEFCPHRRSNNEESISSRMATKAARYSKVIPIDRAG